MQGLKVLTAKHIFGLVFTKYMKEPINYPYNVGSTYFEFVAFSFFRFVIMGVAIGL